MLGTVKQLFADGGIMAEKIIIYGTETCPFCNQARIAYGDRAVFINVKNDAERLKRHLGMGKK